MPGKITNSFLAAAVLSGVIVFPSLAQQTTAHLQFDHFGQNADTTYNVKVDPGQYIVLTINHTCPDLFEYNYHGVKPAPKVLPPPAARHLLSKPFDCKATGTKTIAIPYDPAYGGYFVEIRSSSGDKPVKAFLPNSQTLEMLAKGGPQAAALDNEIDGATNPKELEKYGTLKELAPRAMIAISVSRKPATIEFAGGFYVSSLTDPQYGLLKASVDGTEQTFVVRDRRAEDKYSLGVAAMMHARSVHWPKWLAATFGIGVGNASKVRYFVGPSLRLAGKAFLTLGYEFGPVTRLPAGVRAADVDHLDSKWAVTDPNVLNSLPTRTSGAVFVCFSYAFLGNGLESFNKPFAPPTSK